MDDNVWECDCGRINPTSSFRCRDCYSFCEGKGVIRCKTLGSCDNKSILEWKNFMEIDYTKWQEKEEKKKKDLEYEEGLMFIEKEEEKRLLQEEIAICKKIEEEEKYIKKRKRKLWKHKRELEKIRKKVIKPLSILRAKPEFDYKERLLEIINMHLTLLPTVTRKKKIFEW